MRLKLFLLATLLLLGHFSEAGEPPTPITGTITSIGDFPNRENMWTWALGISNLKFKVILQIPIPGFQHDLHWKINDENVASFKMPCEEEKIINASLVSGMECHDAESTLTLDTRNLSNPLRNIEVVHDASGRSIMHDITVHKCQPTSYQKFSVNTNARYGGRANLSCSDGELVKKASPSLTQLYVICGPYAKWQNFSEFDCWKAPTVRAGNSGNSFNYAHNNTATFTCDVTPGIPDDTTAQLCVGNADCSPKKNISFKHTFTMIPKFNRLNITCNASNSYLERVAGRTAYSNQFLLNVYFGPYLPLIDIDCLASTLHVEFYANPPCVALLLEGDVVNIQVQESNVSHAKYCCGVDRQYFTINISNVGIDELVNITCTGVTMSKNRLFYKNKNLLVSCFDEPPATTSTQNDVTVGTVTSLPLSAAAIAGIAVGGVALILCIALMVYLCWKRNKKSESFNGASQNPAFSASVPDQQNSERQECSNVLYGTADDLKSGGTSGSNSKEVVDNVLYGSTAGPQLSSEVYASVNKTGKKGTNDSEQAADLYSSVQKPKKSKTNGKGVDPGASTSNSQGADTYAEVDKVRKNKKDGKNAGKGKQNAGFSGDLDQDVTYAAVDKKNRKGAKDKKKSDNKPGTSGVIEEATYAQVNKPKKGGPDDEDLHGSNK